MISDLIASRLIDAHIVEVGCHLLNESRVLALRDLLLQLVGPPHGCRFTFGASHRTVHQEWLRYLLANALGWSANNGVYVWMIFSLPLAYQHPALAVAAGSLVGMVFNFSV